jgi:hypothetical protein
MPMTTEMKKISNTKRWCCDEWPCNKCKYKPMKEARAAAERNAEPNGVQRKSHCRRRSGGEKSKGAMAIEGKHGSEVWPEEPERR